MSEFKLALEKKLNDSLSNDFGIENYDELRFGKFIPNAKANSVLRLKQFIKSILGKKESFDVSRMKVLSKALQGLQPVYDQLNLNGRELLVDLLAYRRLGYKKVKLKRNNKEYKNAIETANRLVNPKETYDSHFLHFVLEKFDLNSIGYNIKIFFSRVGIATDFILEQYAYKLQGTSVVEVEKGDVVIDAGACWGDTALYFAHKTGPEGKVYSFEFIPDNIKLFGINKAFNPGLADRIELVERPLSNETGNEIYFRDNGPGSRVEFQPFEGQTGSTTTITIDDFVRANNITKVDFIKMDIEGAEPSALQGAIETIKKHRPKLAIAIYHSMDDFVNIPNWILDLNLDYELFIDHYTIHAEETICFAKPKKRF